ncbi:LLP-like [Homarus americanus]|uniref:LLP-like n=2 Tax=Homarus americanus TaxID=6706 RepID=A0A8J5MLS8_HOMAM|nr:LLP-like [Homarus americanus]
MAKSLRSKWRRKRLREKRVRYGKKELLSLMSVVEKARAEVEIKDAVEVVKALAKKNDETTDGNMQVTSSTGEELQPKEPDTLTLKALIKKSGTAPKWVHPRKVKKIKRQQKSSKTKKIEVKNT